VIFGAAIRRLTLDSEDIDTSQTYSFTDGTATAVSGTAGALKSVAITLTSGANMDSLAAGEPYVFRLRRNATAGGDTVNANDVGVAFVVLEEV
jgi:hypothetical protein